MCRISLASFSFFILAACAFNPAQLGKLRLSIVTVENAKTILPVVSAPASYSISFSGPMAVEPITTSNATVVVELAAGAWSIDISGLDAGGKEIARGGKSGIAISSGATTAEAITLVAQATQAGSGTIDVTVRWTESEIPAPRIDGYVVELTDIAKDAKTVTIGPGLLSYTEVVPSGDYILVITLTGNGDERTTITESVQVYNNLTSSGTITLSGSDFNSRPEAPTGLTVTATMDGLLLSWTDNSRVETRYEVEQSADGSAFSLIESISANSTSYTDSSANSRQTYRVRAANTFGNSDYSNVAAVSSDSCLPANAQIVFLHHSTGNRIWRGGANLDIESPKVLQEIFGYNSASGKSYTIEELSYPNDSYYQETKNFPYDYWHLWVDGGGQAGSYGQQTLEHFAQNYDVIVFKHCFPVCTIEPDTGSPDISSETKSIENYKLQYSALKSRLHNIPGKRFIVWTGAARLEKDYAEGLATEQGVRTRQFFEWVKNVWDEKGDNIFVWDFFELETEGGLFLRSEYGSSEYDSHPNDSFAATVVPFLVKRIVDVIEGRGDTGSLTGN